MDGYANANASESLDKDGAFAYVHGSAGLAWTAKANRQAFEKYKIIPRMLRDATVRDLSVCMLNSMIVKSMILMTLCGNGRSLSLVSFFS